MRIWPCLMTNKITITLETKEILVIMTISIIIPIDVKTLQKLTKLRPRLTVYIVQLRMHLDTVSKNVYTVLK